MSSDSEIIIEDSSLEPLDIEDSMDFPMEDGYTDIALVVEGKRIHLNKGFLMSASPVFKRMFLGEFKEKTSTEIPLPDKKYKEVIIFLKCLLQNEENKLSDNNVIPVMYLAWEYQTIQLIHRCEEYFMHAHFQQDETSVSTEFLMEIYNVGEVSRRETLIATTLKYLAKRAHAEMKSKEIYKSLPLDLRVKLLERRVTELEVFCKSNCQRGIDNKPVFHNNSLRYVNPPARGFACAFEVTSRVTSKNFFN